MGPGLGNSKRRTNGTRLGRVEHERAGNWDRGMGAKTTLNGACTVWHVGTRITEHIFPMSRND